MRKSENASFSYLCVKIKKTFSILKKGFQLGRQEFSATVANFLFAPSASPSFAKLDLLSTPFTAASFANLAILGKVTAKALQHGSLFCRRSFRSNPVGIFLLKQKNLSPFLKKGFINEPTGVLRDGRKPPVCSLCVASVR